MSGLDLIATRREVTRLNQNLTVVSADLHAARVEAYALREWCATLQAERDVAVVQLASARAVHERLAQSLEKEVGTPRNLVSSRISAPLRWLGRRWRTPRR